jgi:hypothetical protein
LIDRASASLVCSVAVTWLLLSCCSD